MNRRLFISSLPGVLAAAQAPFSLDMVRPGHARLLLLDEQLPLIRAMIRDDGVARAVHSRIVEECNLLLKSPTVQYKLEGPRLLAQSRAALDRVTKLALLWRLDGRTEWRDRAVSELRAAAAFPDWNPSHFLDTAEMTCAFAFGYDWLYSTLSVDERAWMREAIVTKGLEPGLGFYENRRGWVNVTHNWNQVCNGGLMLGALAIAEDEPSRAESVCRNGLDSLPRAMASYGPDGGWNEGPGYWHYATRYACYLLSGLETACGSDFGLAGTAGFPVTGHFRTYFAGPAQKTFNYADAGERVEPSEELFWLARRFNQPVYAWAQRKALEASTRATAFDLAWMQTRAQSPQQAGWPLDAYYTGVQTVFLRGSWDNANSVWVAMKGGDNKSNHSHLDLGSFVMDAMGERWAMDFGADDYNLPQYFGPKRWSYYRLRTESHNTVMIDNSNQDPKAAAEFLGKSFTAVQATAAFQLASAYPERLRSHKRTLDLINRTTVRVRDEIESSQPVDVLWGMATGARVELDGRHAVLEIKGKKVKASIAAPLDARFETVSTQPPGPQRQNEGTRKLAVRLPGPVKQVTLEVRLEPIPA